MTKEEYVEYLERRKEDFKRMYPCILSIKEKIDIVENILDAIKRVKTGIGKIYICHELQSMSTKYNLSSTNIGVDDNFSFIILTKKEDFWYLLDEGDNDIPLSEEDALEEVLEEIPSAGYLEEILYSLPSFGSSSDILEDDFYELYEDSSSLSIIALMLPELMDYMPLTLCEDVSYFDSTEERIQALENILQDLKTQIQ
jgi:hypothetical protein